jgi:hypothetical protein
MNSEVVKLYPESQAQEIELSYPEGHRVFAKPLVGLKGIASIGEILTKSLTSLQKEGIEIKGKGWGDILNLLLPRFPDVIQAILQYGYGDDKIEVERLYTKETIGLLNLLLDKNEGLEEAVRSFFARLRLGRIFQAFRTQMSRLSSSPEATP